ncbi:hypothetical protein HPB47_002825 [Ixodes persulcatus]|uniref:Uncharacterized protein n=1 Tax=Ixodes persulcatus TaxID=34615 RepID=A0AC60PKJ1_IXOPE|nr:hypothetical protein HPB47_002825 [Ixodes persulcatus]
MTRTAPVSAMERPSPLSGSGFKLFPPNRVPSGVPAAALAIRGPVPFGRKSSDQRAAKKGFPSSGQRCRQATSGVFFHGPRNSCACGAPSPSPPVEMEAALGGSKKILAFAQKLTARWEQRTRRTNQPSSFHHLTPPSARAAAARSAPTCRKIDVRLVQGSRSLHRAVS